jgi:hypothetical protein
MNVLFEIGPVISIRPLRHSIVTNESLPKLAYHRQYGMFVEPNSRKVGS